jgi:hypothetical protein
MTSIKQFYWPDLDDLWSAKKACRQACSGAIAVGLVTTVAVFLQLKGIKILDGINASGFIDAAVFLVLAFFIYHCSRTAAAIALVLYVAEQVMMGRFSAMGILLTLFFINGVRGSFAYHEFKQGMSREEVQATLKEQKEATEPYVSPLKRAIAWTILIALLGGGGYAYYKHAHPSSSGSSVSIEKVAPQKNTQAAAEKVRASAAVAVAGQQTFKLKNGRTISGRVITNDPVYYTVETSSGKQEVIIKEDLAQ